MPTTSRFVRTGIGYSVKQGSRRRPARGRRLALLTSITALVLAACSGSGPQTALDPQGQQAADIDELWELVFVMASVIGIIVLLALVYSIFRFRERKNDDRRPKQIHGNNTLEITWTIIPAVILAVLAVPTVQGVFDLRAEPTGPDVVQVTVTGHQWWWEFTYPDFEAAGGDAVTTANELHIPAGVPVYLTMTSADVIHSFWVPPLNGKRDVVPGQVTHLTLEAFEPTPPGEYIPGQCAEFCGLAHADMRIRVFVHDSAGFDAWLAGQAEPAVVPDDGPLADAWSILNPTCTACHQVTATVDGSTEVFGPRNTLFADGGTYPSALAPNLTHFGSRSSFAAGVHPNVPDLVAQWLDDPESLKPMSPEFNDIPAGRILGMPDYGLDANQIAGLVALLESWQ